MTQAIVLLLLLLLCLIHKCIHYIKEFILHNWLDGFCISLNELWSEYFGIYVAAVWAELSLQCDGELH